MGIFVIINNGEIMILLRTDMAIEEISSGNSFDYGDYKVSKVIITEEDKKKYNKNPGIYFTIESKAFKLCDDEMEHNVMLGLRDILKNILKELNISSDDEVFVVGLGNDDITPDALGPMCIDRIMVTKHLYTLNELDEGYGIVSALKPGVMGQTGIETSDIIKSVVKSIKPKCVIVIDALASRSLSRVGASIQLSTGGISPGSGVRNKRKEISCKTIGVPVIAIGVPTVVDVKNIGHDLFKALEIENNIDELDITEELDFMLTPKEIDKYIIDLSECIASGINMAIHEIEI